ncbi:MAG TPA: DUF1697 domain-containing protein [Patescibacteria group bacterium]
MVYIAFLRGINVGGHTVTMQRLRELFEELGLQNVRTYIQSGNVFFSTSETDRVNLSQIIELHLRSALGYAVPTFLRTCEEVAYSLEVSPFKGIEQPEDKRFFIMFLSTAVSPLTLPIASPKKDYEIVGQTETELFVILDLSVGRPGNPNVFIEKNFQVQTTSRFYHTTRKILDAAQSI